MPTPVASPSPTRTTDRVDAARRHVGRVGQHLDLLERQGERGREADHPCDENPPGAQPRRHAHLRNRLSRSGCSSAAGAGWARRRSRRGRRRACRRRARRWGSARRWRSHRQRRDGSSDCGDALIRSCGVFEPVIRPGRSGFAIRADLRSEKSLPLIRIVGVPLMPVAPARPFTISVNFPPLMQSLGHCWSRGRPPAPSRSARRCRGKWCPFPPAAARTARVEPPEGFLVGRGVGLGDAVRGVAGARRIAAGGCPGCATM